MFSEDDKEVEEIMSRVKDYLIRVVYDELTWDLEIKKAELKIPLSLTCIRLENKEDVKQ